MVGADTLALSNQSLSETIGDKSSAYMTELSPGARAIGAVGYPDGYVTSNIYMIGCSVMRNCLITNCYWRSVPGHFVNSAMFHCGVAGTNRIENCTIAGNGHFSGDSDATGVWVKGTGVVLRNNIIWGNKAFNGAVANYEFADDASLASASLEYNDTKPAFTAGMGNTSVDPMFVGADSCNYRCRYSYCVDAGGNQEWMAHAVDLDGNARVINSRVDMGCYEHEAQSGFVCRMSVVSDEAPDRSIVDLNCE